MKKSSIRGVAAMLVLLVFGCSSEPVSQSDATVINPTLNGAAADASRKEAGSLNGPLFDLALSPNNKILVADVPIGISNSLGVLQFSLPGVTSIAPIGNGVMWASRGGGGQNTMDSGQAIYRVGNGGVNQIANLFLFEEENNPDGQDVDSNPYAVAATNANEALVADAGANDLLRIDNQGNIEVVAVFPNELVSTANVQALVGCPEPIPGFEFLCNVPMMPAQAVPTSVAIGPDGYYYVGELKGFPGPTGASNIWRIAPDASGAMCGSSEDCVKFFSGGFTSIVDLTFGPDGNLYVAELDEQSWFAVEVLQTGMGGNIKMCNMETMEVTTIATGIPLLTAITFDKQGNLWATQNALIPGLAEVVQISY
ncbi:ScyD/ScyE family protein [Mangrovimonas xylaniphaga]|uniref:ScyD/ScyE family protein n=1 Tax=Mangrovimonas xylaniphaga TaxID=1645915 RepID=UPI0006B5421F|nr:ScyD/ScyE family protein [Mangrovimonas xylaniphaga]